VAANCYRNNKQHPSLVSLLSLSLSLLSLPLLLLLALLSHFSLAYMEVEINKPPLPYSVSFQHGRQQLAIILGDGGYGCTRNVVINAPTQI
jgi:hypothetical protein